MHWDLYNSRIRVFFGPCRSLPQTGCWLDLNFFWMPHPALVCRFNEQEQIQARQSGQGQKWESLAARMQEMKRRDTSRYGRDIKTARTEIVPLASCFSHNRHRFHFLHDYKQFAVTFVPRRIYTPPSPSVAGRRSTFHNEDGVARWERRSVQSGKRQMVVAGRVARHSHRPPRGELGRPSWRNEGKLTADGDIIIMARRRSTSPRPIRHSPCTRPRFRIRSCAPVRWESAGR